MFKKKKEHIFDFSLIKNKVDETESTKESQDGLDLEDFSEDSTFDLGKSNHKKDSIESDNKNKQELEVSISDKKEVNDEVYAKETKTEEVVIQETDIIDPVKEDESILETKDEFELEEDFNKDNTIDSEEKVDSISASDIRKEKFKRSLSDAKIKFKDSFSNFNNYLETKGFKIDKKLISLHINESLRTIILLVVAFFALTQAYDTYQAQDKLSLIKKYYQIKKEIKIEDEKIKENIKAEYLADILKFGVKTENGRYPEFGYLHALNEVFPDNIGELQLLTFLEGWSSEFVDYKGRTIRVDNGLIKTFKQDNDVSDNGLLKGYKYKLVLEGEPSKVENFLYSIRYSNKIPKYFEKIDKKYNASKGLLTVDMDVLFYLSK